VAEYILHCRVLKSFSIPHACPSEVIPEGRAGSEAAEFQTINFRTVEMVLEKKGDFLTGGCVLGAGPSGPSDCLTAQ
jgi:hypothetical protein